MIRINTIRYECNCIDTSPYAKSTDRGMMEFTIVGDDFNNKYYRKVDVNSRHNILNVKNWDYSELSELYIDYAIHGDTPVEIDVNHIIKLPIEKLYLNETIIKGQPRNSRIENGKDCNKYVWDNVLMYLPTLRNLTIVGNKDIVYSLDFTYNPCLMYITLVNMDIRDIKGYDTQNDLTLRLVSCLIGEDIALEMTRNAVKRMREDSDDGFSLELATEW